jgi:hypothetical protein
MDQPCPCCGDEGLYLIADYRRPGDLLLCCPICQACWEINHETVLEQAASTRSQTEDT